MLFPHVHFEQLKLREPLPTGILQHEVDTDSTRHEY